MYVIECVCARAHACLHTRVRVRVLCVQPMPSSRATLFMFGEATHLRTHAQVCVCLYVCVFE